MIGIIGAMEEEVAQLKNQAQIIKTIEQASMIFYQGILWGQEVVIVRSGIGKVNGAVCAQILIDKFQVDALINTGIAGSLNVKIEIGDIVISKDAIQHDVDASIFGDPVGQIPRMDILAFPADTSLIEKARSANELANPNITTFVGRIVSGDQFISSKEKKESLTDFFQGDCAEMEGAAIAQVAYLNHIPYVVIRAISDKADNSASVDYPAFEKQAIIHSVNLLKHLLPTI